MRHSAIFAAAVLLSGVCPAQAQLTASPDGAKAYILSPQDGETVQNPFNVVFGLSGMGIAPAGTDAENTGHHHLLIDISPDALNMEESLPSDDSVRHFGGGQTEVALELPPGNHTLQLLLGDMNHIPHATPVLSKKITINVE